MLDQAKNFIKLDLTAGINASATVISFGDASSLPDPASGEYNLVLWNSTDYVAPHLDPNVEIVRAISLSVNDLTIQRPAVGNSYNGEGLDNTASTHNASGKTYSVALGFTKKTIDDIDTELAGKETANANIQAHIIDTENPHAVDVSDVGLDNVDNTADLDKPLSYTAIAALAGKEPANANIQSHIINISNPHSVTKTQVGLGSVTNDLQIPASEKGANSGVAELDASGKIPTNRFPALVISETFVVATEVAQLATGAEQGDTVVRTDESKTYIHNGGTAGTMADYTEMLTPTDIVTSVAGKTGPVTLIKGDVGLGNVDNTSDANKPVSTATQTALDLKSDATHNHDSDYSDILHDHDGSYSALGHAHNDVYYTEAETDSLLSGKSGTGHNHDAEYSLLGHNHDSSYAALVHNHDSSYAALAHNHDATYSALAHTHDDRYYTEDEVDSLIDGVGGAPTGADTHVMFFDGTDNPAGVADFTYAKTNKVLTINGMPISKPTTNSVVMGTTPASMTGIGHTLYGFEAGEAITSATYMGAYGFRAMKKIQTGSGSIAIGREAMSNTTGTTYSIALGYRASYNTTGNYNLAMGYRALYTNTTGTSNVAIGQDSMYAATTGSDKNVAIGGYSLASITSAKDNNVALGYEALRNSTSATSNVAVGSGSQRDSSATTAISIGTNALRSGSGSAVIAIGYQTGYNAKGNNNAFFGSSAGYGHSDGTSVGVANFGAGTDALKNFKGGSYNWAGGYYALRELTEGDNNFAGGREAGRYITTGDYNIAIGYRAINSAAGTTGSYNIVFGAFAGDALTSGKENLFAGRESGSGTTTGDGNVFLGRRSGYLNVTGEYGVFLGYNAGYNETASNKLYIANTSTTNPLIYGDFATSELKVNGDFEVTGGLTLGYVTKTATYTITTSDYLINCTANTFTTTLPTASGITGRQFIVKNSGTGVVTLDGNGSETIDGATTQTLNQYDSMTVVSDGTNWIVI